MNTFNSHTGYIKRKADNTIYETSTIYLGKFDKAENYTEATKEEYEAYLKEMEYEVHDSEEVHE